jgi:AraC-like DNA-binding protein
VAKTAEKGSISIAFVREALHCLSRRGLDPEPLAQACGIAPTLLLSDDARVTADSFGALWLAIARALDDEFFGLDSRRMKVGSYALLCRLAMHCGTLNAAIGRIAEFMNLILDDTRVLFSVSGPEASITLADSPGASTRDESIRIFAHETLFVLIHGLMCWLVNRRIPLRHARFAYTRPAWSPEYGPIFCHDLGFAAPQTRIVFGSACLQSRIVQTARSRREFLKGAPGNFLLKYRDEKSLAARIRRRLRDTPPAEWPSFDRLAAELGLGASTLHRTLQRDGSPFRTIKEGLRRDLAIKHLTHSEMSIGDIAEALGFAEPSAFHRAFKNWTGVRPREYRIRSVGSSSFIRRL